MTKDGICFMLPSKKFVQLFNGKNKDCRNISLENETSKLKILR